jgi:mono/diheme cytochrome c family protein
MGRMAKILGIMLLGLFVVLAVVITATIGWRPFIGPKARPLTDRKFESTPERLVRGQYLAEELLLCFDCHGQHDWSKHDAPLIAGTKGAGVDPFPLQGLPGKVVPRNITPDRETGAGTWTDDMLARAIREGIGHDGRALFFMPYPFFRHLSDEDLASVIVYVRSLEPVRNPLPPSEIGFPVKYLMRSGPQPLDAPVPPPDLSTPLSRGKYLVSIAPCADCHTPLDKGQPNAALPFAGGSPLYGPWGKVASANLTPDPSGIPYYDEALFVSTMRTGYVKARKLSQIMPWHMFRHLTDDDLKAMFAYLRTLPPVKHRVDNAEPPTPCKLCGYSHGAGDKN